MRIPVPRIPTALGVALLLGLLTAAPAQAEKWMWFQIKGGAVAYDADSRRSDGEKAVVGADTLIYYDQPRRLAEGEFNFVAERLEFECRGERHRWLSSAVLDADGKVVLARPDGEWTPMPRELGSTALFSRMLCLSQEPPGGKIAPSRASLISAMKQANAGMSSLASLAFPAPRVVVPTAPVVATVPAPRAAPRSTSGVDAPAPPAAATPAAPNAPTVSTAPASTTPAPSDPIGRMIAAAPAPAPKLLAAEPRIATVEPKALARSLGPTIPAPAGSTPYPVADRCLLMKEGRDMDSQFVFNECAYRVNYAWCVTGSQDPRAECGGPTLARGAGTVLAKSNAQSSYPGGLGRLYLFGCRAPGTPVVTRADGKLTHQCLGPAPATAAATPAPQKLPELRRLSPGV